VSPRRIGFLLVSLLFLALLAIAQEHAAQPAAEPAKQPAQAEGQPGQELVEASKEAEAGGEEDEEAKFKYSASVQWLARKTHLSTEAAYWLAISVNFLVVAGFIAWGVKKSAPIHFRDRTAAIKKQLEEARAASEDANRRLAEIEGRLARLDTEIAAMRGQAERDAATEEQRLRAAAEEDRQKIVTSAEQEIASAAKIARGELKKYVAELAVTLAEKKVDVTAATDQGLVRRFVEGLGNERLGEDGGKR
jgi:F-type H+-transporting ATPase subunit b